MTGCPLSVVEGVRRAVGNSTGAANFSVSDTGTLAFLPGPVGFSSAQLDLAVAERSGNISPLKLQPGPYEFPRVSPDGKRIAFNRSYKAIMVMNRDGSRLRRIYSPRRTGLTSPLGRITWSPARRR